MNSCSWLFFSLVHRVFKNEARAVTAQSPRKIIEITSNSAAILVEEGCATRVLHGKGAVRGFKWLVFVHERA